MDLNVMKSLIVGAIPWVQMSDIRVDWFKPCWVKLSVPVQEKHLNHVGMVYSATQVMLMEVTGAALFIATYGPNLFTPIIKDMSVNYLRPSYRDIACELRIEEKEAALKIEPIKKRGRGSWPLDMAVTDATGARISISTCRYYLIAAK